MNKITKKRRQMKWSYGDLAIFCGTTELRVRRWEMGKEKPRGAAKAYLDRLFVSR